MAYDVRIDRLPPFALFDLKGPQAALSAWAPGLPQFPARPNSLTRAEGAELCHIGPDRWLLRAPLAAEAEWEAALNPAAAPADISVVRVSDTQTFFRITGADADQILAIGCPLDVHASVFGDDAVSHTEFFAVKALVLRCAGGFDCAVEQSFGDMIEDYLNRATA